MNSDTYDKFLSSMQQADYLAVDTEASGNDIRDGRGFAMGVSCAWEDHGILFSVYLPFRHEADNLPKDYVDGLKMVLENHRALVFHNAKFDIVSLATLGIEIKGPFYDTMLFAHLLNETPDYEGGWGKSLDWLAHHFFKEGKDDEKVKGWAKAFGWSTIPSAMMAPYAKKDAELTLRLFHKLYPMLQEQDLDKLWDVEQRFVRLLCKMERRGVRIDLDLCRQQAIYGRQRMDLITQTLGLNPGSPKDLAVLLFDELKLEPLEKHKTAKDAYSFNKAAMVEYDKQLEERKDERAGIVKEYRGWQKACAVAYEGYPALVSPDGRLRPNYNMHRVTTGRLSCSEPNLQQIPRVSNNAWDGKLKAVFIPAEGYELWEADYSQLEFRLGAAYAEEHGLIEQFADPDGDVFTVMASELGMERRDVKTLTYSLQYGGGVNRISNVFGVTPERAKQIRDNYFDTYPGFRRMANKASKAALKRGYVKTFTGRRRHFLNPTEESHKAFNSVVQGGAAEIVKHAMLRLEDQVDGDECRMLLQVHDSVVFEIRSDKVQEYVPRIKRTMETVTPDFGVAFYVDCHPWGAS